MTSQATERHRITLRRRLLTLLLPALALMLVASLVADYRIALDPAQAAYDQALADDAIVLASRIRQKAGTVAIDLPAAAEDVLRSDSIDQEFLAVYGPEGELLAGDADLKPELLVNGPRPHMSDTTLRGLRLRQATYRIDTVAGTVTVTVAETTHKRQRSASKIMAAMALPNFLLIVGTLVLVLVSVRNGLAPLEQLGEEIARRPPHELTPLPDIDIPAEAQPLVDSMNVLIQDLRIATEAQQAFLANAAHQLKTPIAALQTQLELATQEAQGAQRERMVNLLAVSERIGHLAHQLLALARSGHEANLSREFRSVDLADLLRQNASSWFSTALQKDIDLGFEADPAVTMGIEWLLREMLSNLIDNALRYTPPSGTVTARSGIDADGCPFVEVEDSGPGIAEEDRERVFERFYRPLGSPGTGTGLGLAIVKEVADRHDGRIDLAASRALGGTLVRVTFPLPKHAS